MEVSLGIDCWKKNPAPQNPRNLACYKLDYTVSQKTTLTLHTITSMYSTSCCNSYGLLGWSTVVTAVADDAVTALILLTNWCYTKMASRETVIICTLYIIIILYCVQNIIKIG